MLKRALLVRHAESEEDVDPTIRSHIIDSRISVTAAGKKQVEELARKLRPSIKSCTSVRLIASVTNRALQTTQLFSSHFPQKKFDVVHDDRIRSLNWGNVDETTIRQVERERYKVGVLYFQFPEGDDTKSFVKGIEDFVSDLRLSGQEVTYPECLVIFTHGFALRVIAKAALGISDEDFRYLANPPNCYVATLNFSRGKFSLEDPLPIVNFEIK